MNSLIDICPTPSDQEEEEVFRLSSSFAAAMSLYVLRGWRPIFCEFHALAFAE